MDKYLRFFYGTNATDECVQTSLVNVDALSGYIKEATLAGEGFDGWRVYLKGNNKTYVKITRDAASASAGGWTPYVIYEAIKKVGAKGYNQPYVDIKPTLNPNTMDQEIWTWISFGIDP
tara:strand:- start:128 stop:484 length:357 start_codon:yes stop_codon:yes gene_type:complete